MLLSRCFNPSQVNFMNMARTFFFWHEHVNEKISIWHEHLSFGKNFALTFYDYGMNILKVCGMNMPNN